MTSIIYFGQSVCLACDAKCNKAWGINNRPKVILSETDEDDYYWLPDQELGEAPEDPGTYEGMEMAGKPTDKVHNKWCARECERSIKARSGEYKELPDFTKPVFNIPRDDD